MKVPANLAGTASKAYTVVFPSKGLGSQPAGFTLADYPQGDGYATVTVYINGTVSVVGKLADGTPISASAPLSKTNTWPLFKPLYPVLGVTKGCIAGQVTLDDTQVESDMAGTDLLWFRPFQLVQWYPYGWDEGVLVDLTGAKYVVPPATPATSVFPGPGPASALKAADPVNGNVGATFSDGLLSGPITRSVNISPDERGDPTDVEHRRELHPRAHHRERPCHRRVHAHGWDQTRVRGGDHPEGHASRSLRLLPDQAARRHRLHRRERGSEPAREIG